MRKLSPVFLLLIFAACATTFVSGYRAASIEANTFTENEYTPARVELDKLHTAGKLTAAQSARYQEIHESVRLAGRAHDRSITQWRDSGLKPSDYDAAAKALRDAEQNMIDLKNEVTQ